MPWLVKDHIAHGLLGPFQSLRHRSIRLLNELEWKRFEEVVSEYYGLLGYRSKVTRMGADGGVDVVLYQQGAETPSIIIQCKAWSKKVGVKAKEVRIKKMKTKWGTCNQKDKRIWLNLELAKQLPNCIDYVIVHELVHLKERRHNDRFLKLLSDAYPRWQQAKEELNHGILSYFEWGCKSNPKLKNVIEN